MQVKTSRKLGKIIKRRKPKREENKNKKKEKKV